MIDLHCHILPNLDDGPDSLATALKMAKKAVKEGITHILATPHHNMRYSNPKHKIMDEVAWFQNELNQAKIPLRIFEGQEVRVHSNLLDEIQNDRILFTDVEDTYLQLELPSNEVPEYFEVLLYDLRNIGITPILVHPERNSVIYNNPNLLYQYLNMGVLSQITAPSIVGVYGKEIQKFAHKLIETNMAHMLASDAHEIGMRDFHMKQAYGIIRKHHGKGRVYEMKEVARKCLNGDPVKVPQHQAL
ncbi:MAG: tyrosine protein phosphatase [Streptococcaceae bacterium]|jgi:protein-tyrosine phosphatase|nr:tyrosine protein phosphatase [Streptococcaceae bacterium]